MSLYGQSREVFDDLNGWRVRAAAGRGWWTEHEGDLPLHLRAYIELEDAAERIDTCELEVIPGLLQTPDYIRVQAEIYGETSRDAIAQTIWHRMGRQAKLLESAERLNLDAIVAESALRRCVASNLLGQIEELLDHSWRMNVTLRVLPCRNGIHGITGSYTIITLPGNKLDPVMYLEYPGGSILVEEKRAVDATLRKHAKLPALDPGESREFLKEFIVKNRGGSVGVA